MELMKKKDALEAEIHTLHAVSKPGPLVDEEGFPRNDIDVHAERITRSQLAMLQNDHKAVMNDIEASLHTLHAKTAGVVGSKLTTTTATHTTTPTQVKAPVAAPRPSKADLSGQSLSLALNQLDAFYLCGQVDEGSPAKEAGLCIGDKVLQFGNILRRNQPKAGLGQLLQEVVATCRDTPIKVVVYRNGEGVLDLHLTPHPWAGRGLLGCKLVPCD